MKEPLLVALGGLLHDIGKFVQRARWGEKIDQDKSCLEHEKWGYDFLYGFKDKNSVFERLATFAGYHHKESLEKADFKDVRMLNLLWIVYEADNLSSMEREGEKAQFGNPLVSVFSSINLGKGNTERCYYDLVEYDPNAFFQPTPEKITINKRKYEMLYRKFVADFMNVIERSNDNNFFDHVLALLEKYTTFVPSIMSGEDDSSLYDHLKTTSAIALCLYHYHKEDLDRDIKNRILDRNEKKYLLVGGDISGIQDFIYMISSKGALKYLRARSIFLELLTEDVVEEIIGRLKLTRANVIYCGGGHFYVLAPNTEQVKSEIERIRNSVNRWLFNRYRGKLYLAIDYVELRGGDFENLEIDGVSVWDLLKKRLKVAKSRKFLDVVPDLMEKDYWDNRHVCDVCGMPTKTLKPIGDDISVCEACEELYAVGDAIPKKILCFVRWKRDEKLRETYPAITLPFSTFYAVYEEIFEKVLEDFPKEITIFLKNSFGFDGIFREYRIVPYFVSDYVVRNEKGVIKNFDELGKESKGAKKIAVLRMDVDDLGKVFSVGFRGKRTLSRYATLSRFMNHFFKNCVRLIAKGDESVRSILGDRNLPKLFEKGNGRNVVIVYSGGDDLFIVGSWNDVFEMAFEIRELFGEYVGWNPNLTISAGFAVFDPKYPLYRMAKITKDRLDGIAKEEGEEVQSEDTEIKDVKIKDRIMLLERIPPKGFEKTHKVSYRWEEFKKVWNRYVPNIYNASKGELKISRSILRKILEARWKYVENPRGFKWHISLIYYLSRAKLIDTLGDLARRDVNRAKSGKPQGIYYIDVPLRIVDLAIRG